MTEQQQAEFENNLADIMHDQVDMPANMKILYNAHIMIPFSVSDAELTSIFWSSILYIMQVHMEHIDDSLSVSTSEEEITLLKRAKRKGKKHIKELQTKLKENPNKTLTKAEFNRLEAAVCIQSSDDMMRLLRVEKGIDPNSTFVAVDSDNPAMEKKLALILKYERRVTELTA